MENNIRKIYKIKFEFDKSNIDISDMRDQSIQGILSALEDIQSDSPIQIPSDGSIFMMGDQDYKVISHKYHFSIIGDILFYQTIIKISSISQIQKQENGEKFLDNNFLDSYSKYLSEHVRSSRVDDFL